MDWSDKAAVIAAAKRMNATSRAQNVIVYKHPDRTTYNITHLSRTDLYMPDWVVWQP